MKPRRSLSGFSPPRPSQQQQQQSSEQSHQQAGEKQQQQQQQPGREVSEPHSSQPTEQSQVPKGWLGLGAPTTGLLSLLRPSAGSQQGSSEAVQNRERTLDWLHASNLMRIGMGGSSQHSLPAGKGGREGSGTSRSTLAAKVPATCSDYGCWHHH